MPITIFSHLPQHLIQFWDKYSPPLALISSQNSLLPNMISDEDPPHPPTSSTPSVGLHSTQPNHTGDELELRWIYLFDTLQERVKYPPQCLILVLHSHICISS